MAQGAANRGKFCCTSKPMPAGLAAVFSFIPTPVALTLKKFIKDDKIIVFDTTFKVSTKYTPALLIVMICLSFANELIRDVDMQCMTSDQISNFGILREDEVDEELNTYCWTHDTFLVERALSPYMEGRVTFPGISGREGSDDIIKQRYYKYVWLGFGVVACCTFVPLFLWKVRGADKIKRLKKIKRSKKNYVRGQQPPQVQPQQPMGFVVPENHGSEPIPQHMGFVVPQNPADGAGNENSDDEDDDLINGDLGDDEIRANRFCETIGLNSGFGMHYFACKFLAMVSPIVGWFYLCGFVGGRYSTYGIDVMKTFTVSADPWPHPMDALFPKMAKCEWAKYGITGDREVKSAQCKLPMNNLSQWSFFILWWWLMAVFLVNAISFIKLAVLMWTPYRTYRYRKFIAVLCREEIQEMNSDDSEDKSLIKINLGFGEWLVLSLLKKNLKEKQFRGFIRALVKTPANNVFRLETVGGQRNRNLLQVSNKTRPADLEFGKPDYPGFRSNVLHTPIRGCSAPPMSPFNNKSASEVFDIERIMERVKLLEERQSSLESQTEVEVHTQPHAQGHAPANAQGHAPANAHGHAQSPPQSRMNGSLNDIHYYQEQPRGMNQQQQPYPIGFNVNVKEEMDDDYGSP